MLAWIDLETTGLDPKKGSILELAIVLTDDDLAPISDPFSSIVRPIHLRGIEAMDDYVKRMHEKSGLSDLLFEEVMQSEGVVTINKRGVPRCGEVEAQAVAYCRAVGEPLQKVLKKTPLAGSSVHFDRAWIAEHMPDLEALFSHRNVDVSTLNELAVRWDPSIYEMRPRVGLEPKHRALDDIYASMDVLAHYRRCLFDGLYAGASK